MYPWTESGSREIWHTVRCTLGHDRAPASMTSNYFGTDYCSEHPSTAVQGLFSIMPRFGTRTYTAPPPARRSCNVPCPSEPCPAMVPTWPSTQLLSASAHGHSELWRHLQRTRRVHGGSMRTLRTRRGDELARSPVMTQPPLSMMPSLRRPCGRPSCSCAAICRLAAAGRPENHQGTQNSRARPSLDFGS